MAGIAAVTSSGKSRMRKIKRGDPKGVIKELFGATIAGLLLFMCTSCATSQTALKSADVMRLHPGMIEKEVVAILHANPSSRSFFFNDGTYLLRWENSPQKEGGGDIRHLSILFQQDSRMITIVEEENFSTEEY
jgi:hypothetical protein